MSQSAIIARRLTLNSLELSCHAFSARRCALLVIVRARRAPRRVLTAHGTERAVAARDAVRLVLHHRQRQVHARPRWTWQRRRRTLSTVVAQRAAYACSRALRLLELPT